MSLDDVFLHDMLTAARKIVRITASLTVDDFSADDVVQDSVIRQISIIAEAARQLTDAFKDTHDTVPWHVIRGMRNRLIHDYKHVDIKEVWKTVRTDIPELIHSLEPLVPPEEDI